MNPIVYRSTDPAAPILTGQVGSFAMLMRALLVGTSGIAYGSGDNEKPSAGWTLAFDDMVNYKTALRNDPAEGSGGYLFILDDGSGTGATAAQAHMQVYRTMSDINTGTDATPVAVSGWPGARIEKSGGANSTPVDWIVVADNRTVYFATRPSELGFATFYGAGDYHSLVPGFNYSMFCAGGRHDASNNNNDKASAFSAVGPGIVDTSDSGPIYLMRNYDSSPGNVRRFITGPKVSADPPWGTSGFPNPSVYLGNNIPAFQPMVGSNIGIIGYFRGLLLPLNNASGLVIPSVLGGDEPGSALQLLRLVNQFSNTGSSVNGAVLIQLDSPW